jgi:hypothetical protein
MLSIFQGRLVISANIADRRNFGRDARTVATVAIKKYAIIRILFNSEIKLTADAL